MNDIGMYAIVIGFIVVIWIVAINKTIKDREEKKKIKELLEKEKNR